jgi:tetratricopeptide (TPR) repeat protein
MRRLAPWLLFAFAVATAATGAVRLHRPGAGDVETSLLYLPNGRHLRLASLGHSSLVADFVYLWAIQYYANYTRADRARYVEHVFGEVIPDLDPRYVDAYGLGALILAVEVGDLDAALRVLDRGIEDNPDQWILPYIAGWEALHAGRPEIAAEYLDRAAATPGAPGVLLRNRAGMLAKAGDLRAAYRTWREIRDDPGADETTRKIADQRMRDLQVRIDLEDLARAVEVYRARTGRSPRDLDAIVRAGVLESVPLDPEGQPYRLDPDDGAVTTAGGRRLEGS